MSTPVEQVAREQFPYLSRICLNAARWHPLPLVAVEAVSRHARFRAADGSWEQDIGSMAQDGARAAFAQLIGADPDDVALVPSTTVAEQLVVRALDIPRSGAVLTDLMHFDGSIYAYDSMRAAGADVRVIEPRAGRLDPADFEAELRTGDVRLVAVSAASGTTGHCHDLAVLSAMAHAYGALVYADIVQVAGAVPFDVAASGVDFCAASSFKWLMGEMGLGFLYARPGIRLGLRRPIYGYRQLLRDIEPWPPTGPRAWSVSDSSAGYFEAASLPVSVAVSLEASIGLISSIGVEDIARHRKPLLKRIDNGLEDLGYRRLTPSDSDAPFLVFDWSHRRDTDDRLRSANINAGILGEKLRVSISIFNTLDDVEQLLAALR